jgi:hypothetical protein
VLQWATYYGGSGFDQAWGLACDGFGNEYISGITESIDSIATAGAYHNAYGGGDDVFLAKFNTTGTLIWATYFGGSGAETNRYVACDVSGNVYISGGTSSADSIATPGAWQTVYSGKNDAFLAKFNSGGSLQWATYYGGSGSDGAYGVACFDTNAVYITGATRSTAKIATPGAYQTGGGGIKGDAFVAKFSNTGSLLWGTYYGGSQDDAAYSVTCDYLGSVYITGNTSSIDSIASAGAYKTTMYGGDGFLAKFESSGPLVWGTYFNGSGYDVACDHSANVYMTGSTFATDSVATTGAYKLHYYGGGTGMYAGDAFLSKFSSSGAILWGTYYGGSGADLGYGVTCDAAGNVYLCGLAQSSDSISTTGSYQPVFGGGYQDGFVAKFGELPALPTTVQRSNIPENIVVYPNPAKNNIYINYDNIINCQILITDITGRELICKKIDDHQNNATIDVHSLSPGLYLYKISGNGYLIKTGKIIKE